MTNGFAVNLNWTPVESGSPTSYYVVYRDGAEIGTVSSGSSYRDSSVSGGTVLQYEVTTVLVTETESVADQRLPVIIPGYPAWEAGWTLTLNQNSSQSVSARASDPLGYSLTFSRVGGTAPAGVTVSSSGVVSLTTAAGGSYTLILRADNGFLYSDFTVSVAVVAANQAPVFTVAPTTSSLPSSGGTIQFTASDPEGSSVVYSLPTTRAGITINSSTGLVTVSSSAAGTTGSIVVRASDGSLTTSVSCSVTVSSTQSSDLPWPKVSSSGPAWLHGTLNLYSGQLTNWRTWMGHQPDIMGVYVQPQTWTQFRTGRGSSQAYLYPVIASVPHDTPIILAYNMYPRGGTQAAFEADQYYVNSTTNRFGGNKNLEWPQMWTNFNNSLYDEHYRAMARGLKNLCADTTYGKGSDGIQRSASDFILRLGWEMNGDWYEWSIGNNVAAFKQAWARVVGIIRTEIPGIWFDFSPTKVPVRGTNPLVYIEDYTPDPSTFNTLSVSHHDAATRSGDSTSTVTRTNPATWTPHETALNKFLAHAKSLGKKMALTEWASQMADCDTTYHVQAQDPEWFYQKTWEWLYANRAYIAWDTHFSPSCCSLVTRQSTSAAVYFKSKWGS
jgi:hypothetical protein